MYRKLSIGVIIVIVLLSAFFSYRISLLEFNYNFEEFFPASDEDTEYFNTHRHVFESDNDFVLVGITNNDGIFNQEFLATVQTLTDSIAQLPSVTEVLAPTNLKDFIRDPLMGAVIERPILRYEQPGRYAKDSAKIYQNEELIGSYFSKDGKSVSIFAKTEEYISKEKCDVLAENMKRVVAQFEFDEVHVAGRSVGQSYYVELMQKELSIFVLASFILVLVFLVIAFRTFWGVWVPIMVVLLSIVWILGVMSVTGKPIDLMLTMLPTIMFVVGMSDVVHILNRYLEELREGNDKITAVKTSFKEVGLATFLTSLTTAAGFLTLLMANILPIRSFGVYTATGVFLAYILAYSLLPAVMILSKPPKTVRNKKNNQVFWTRMLRRLFLWVIRHKTVVLVGAAVILVVSIIGIREIRVNSHLLEDLNDGDPLKESFTFFEDKFAGVRPFEMSFIVKDSTKSVFDREVLLEFEQIERYLKDEYGVGFLLSPVTIIKYANKGFNGGSSKYYKIPDNNEECRHLVDQISKFKRADIIKAFVSENQLYARMGGRMADVGSYKVRQLDEGLIAFMEEHVDLNLLEYRITGTARLMDKNNMSLAANMMQGLMIAFLVVGLVVGLLFRSLKMIVISLIPNIFPLLMVAGIMGLSGIPLKATTSIIFTIAFGIAVDDTIHFVSKLKLELRKGRSFVYAVKRTFLTTGKAIIVTSIILCGGFLTLIMSDFNGTFYTGLLISLTLFFAVIADLLLLPVLLLLFYGKKGENN